MAQRRKRRTKAEIEADKKAKAAQAAEDAKMEAEGYVKKRLRDEHGHFIKDDPSTPENEAWEWVKKEEERLAEAVRRINEDNDYIRVKIRQRGPYDLMDRLLSHLGGLDHP